MTTDISASTAPGMAQPGAAGTPQVSIVIPMYNESHRMKHSLPRLRDYFRNRPYSVEFVVVDDGSSDNTLEMARQIMGQKDVQYLEEKPNRGKGHAVKVGMLAAN